MRFSIQSRMKKDVLSFSRSSQQSYRIAFDNHQNDSRKRRKSTYHRKSDNKLFEIRKKIQSKFSRLKVKDFFSLEEIQAKFGLSPTKFLNQVKNDQFAKKIDWISPELFPGSEATNESETEKIDELEVLRNSLKSIRQR